MVLVGWDHVSLPGRTNVSSSRRPRAGLPASLERTAPRVILWDFMGFLQRLLFSARFVSCLLLRPWAWDGAGELTPGREWASMEALPSRAVPRRVNVRCCLAVRSAPANTDLFNPIWREVGEAAGKGGGGFPSLNLVGFSYSRFQIWAANGAALARGGGTGLG